MEREMSINDLPKLPNPQTRQVERPWGPHIRSIDRKLVDVLKVFQVINKRLIHMNHRRKIK